MVNPRARTRVSRRAYTLAGLVFVGLGVAGIALPVLPGTVFFILALYCFRRGSDRMESWLLHHPRIGPTLRDWEASGSIRRRTKVVAITAIWLAIGVSATIVAALSVRVLLVLTAAALTAYLWTRPEPAPVAS